MLYEKVVVFSANRNGTGTIIDQTIKGVPVYFVESWRLDSRSAWISDEQGVSTESTWMSSQMHCKAIIWSMNIGHPNTRSSSANSFRCCTGHVLEWSFYSKISIIYSIVYRIIVWANISVSLTDCFNSTGSREARSNNALAGSRCQIGYRVWRRKLKMTFIVPTNTQNCSTLRCRGSLRNLSWQCWWVFYKASWIGESAKCLYDIIISIIIS